MGFTDTSLLWRVGLFFTFVGFVMTLAGVTSSYMVACELIPNMEMHIGMWDICDDTRSFSCRDLEEFLRESNDDTDWVLGSRAMSVMGLILMGLSPLVSLYLTYALSSQQTTGLVAGTINTVAFIFCVIGGGVFIKFSEDLLEATAQMEGDLPGHSLFS